MASVCENGGFLGAGAGFLCSQVPELLDVGGLRLHTYIMLSCRNGPRLRWFALLGLVLLGIVTTNGTWAATGGVNDTPDAALSFPFLSVDIGQGKMLANAFMFQMRLFTGATGQDPDGTAVAGGGFAAMRYLAMMAVMVGFILILFFKKYQRVAVIVPWALLVLITVFVPLGSKLLFYPIKWSVPGSLAEQGSTRAAMSPNVHDGSSCITKPQGCGFTPQLVAIHLGSSLQMIVSDIFRSSQWSGLLAQQAAATRLQTMADFNMGTGWLNSVQNFTKICQGVSWQGLLPNPSSGAAANDGGLNSQGNYVTLGTMMDTYYNANFGSNNIGGTLPPMIVLPEQTKDADTLWGADNTGAKNAYENGITKLYKKFGADADQVTAVKFTPTGANEISVQTALSKMNNVVGLPTVDSTGQAAPLGVIFMKYSDFGKTLEVRRCYVQDKTPQGKWLSDLFSAAPTQQGCVQNYTGSTGGGGRTGGYGAGILLKSAVYSPGAQADRFNQFYENRVNPTDSLNSNWGMLANLYHDGDTLKSMPVGYGIPQRTAETTWSLGSVLGTSPAPYKDYPAVNVPDENHIKGALTCNMLGAPLVKSAIDALSNKGGSGKQVDIYFDKLVDLLNKEGTGTSFPAGPLTMDNMTSKPNPQSTFPEGKVTMITSMLTRINEDLRTAEESSHDAPLTADQRREIAARSVVQLMESVTQEANDMVDESQKAANKDGRSVNIVGNELLSSVGGGLAEYLGEGLTRIFSKFTGPLAVAYVYFLNVLIDMTLLAMIVMTPFLFLMGLLIPTSAAGVLMISIMSVLVLKFVPVTLILLNALGGMMYMILPSSMGTNGGFARDLLVIAMSGMYMSCVGLTFFLMFKLGDPAAFLGRLVALDAASKKLADTGWDATKALAAAAVAVAAGGVGGGLGGAWQASRRYLGPAGDLADAGIKKLGGEGGSNDGSGGVRNEEGTPPSPVNELDPNAAGAATEDMFAEGEAGEVLPDMDGMDAAALGGTMGLNTPKNNVLGSDGKYYNFYKDEDGSVTATRQDDGKEFKVSGPLSGDRVTADMGAAMTRTQLNNLQNLRSASNANLKLNDFAATVPAGETRTFTDSNGVNHQVSNDAATGVVSADGVNLTNGQRTAQASPIQQVGSNDARFLRSDEIATMANNVRQNVAAAVDTSAPQQTAATVPAQLSRMEEARQAAAANQTGTGATTQPAGGVGAGVFVTNQVPAQPVAGGAAAPAANSSVAQPGGGGGSPVPGAPAQAGVGGAAPTVARTYQQPADGETQRYADTLGRGVDGELRDTLNKRVVTQLAEIEVEMKTNITDKRREQLEDVRSKLTSASFDTAALSMGELAAKHGQLSQLQKAMAYRSGADEGIGAGRDKKGLAKWGGLAMAAGGGAWKGAVSGLYGSFTGAFGNGTGSIPFIGPALREIANEVYQAPERANAVKMAGGLGKWWAAKGDAERMKFYTQEMSPLVSGYQYQQMLGAGAFQGQYEVARQAASEAVARTRSNHLALNAAGGVMSARDLAGLGSLDAGARLAATRADAIMASGNTVKMDVALVDKNNRLTGKTAKIDVAMTPQLIQEMQGGIGVKAAAGKVNDMLLSHYSIGEKQYMRGGEWDKTRNMANDANAARKFAMEDIDNDYMVEGRLKMVTGKENFMDMRAQHKTLIAAMHHDNLQYERNYNKTVSNAGGNVVQAYQTIVNDPANAKKYQDQIVKINNSTGADIAKAQALLVRKWSEDNTALADLKLKPIFEDAATRGAMKWPVKAMSAIYSQGNESAALMEAVDKLARANLKAAGMAQSNFNTQRINTAQGPAYTEGAAPSYLVALQRGLADGKTSREEAAQFAGEFLNFASKNLGSELNKFLSTTKISDNSFVQTVDKSMVDRLVNIVRTQPDKAAGLSEGLRSRLAKIASIGGASGVFKEGDPTAGEEHFT